MRITGKVLHQISLDRFSKIVLRIHTKINYKSRLAQGFNHSKFKMNKVNLFIVGAPKCGTTAFSEYISTHPDIKVSSPKEPYFFCKDFKILISQPQCSWKNIEHYHKSCYGPELYTHKIICDATVWNLYSEVAAAEMISYNPDAKFLVMLRNPVDMIYSLHSMYVGLGFEDVRDFRKAFSLQDQRTLGKYLPESSVAKLDPDLLCYGNIGMIGKQLERLYQTVPKKQVKVIFFEDFSCSPLEIYSDILSFLGLPHDGRETFSRINSQRKIRSHFLINLYQSQSLRKYAQVLKKVLHIQSFGFGIAKPPMPPEVRKFLLDFYKEDILKLSELTNRSLKHWFTESTKA